MGAFALLTIFSAVYLHRVNLRMEAMETEFGFMGENVRVTSESMRLAALTPGEIRLEEEDPYGLGIRPRITGELAGLFIGPDAAYRDRYYSVSDAGDASFPGDAASEETSDPGKQQRTLEDLDLEVLSGRGSSVAGETLADLAALFADGEETSADAPDAEGSGEDVTSGTASDTEADGDTVKVYLTFDDGPSTYTDDILDILAAYDVKATFFVVGRTDEHSLEMYRRIVSEGHTLGMHSYSHKYSEIYRSLEAFDADYTKLSDLLTETTGVTPTLYRFPGGSSNRVSDLDITLFEAYLKGKGTEYIDWNVSAQDAVSGTVPRKTIVRNVLDGIPGKDKAVVLMHDAGDKYSTVLALPEIIEGIQEMDRTELLPLSGEIPDVRQITVE